MADSLDTLIASLRAAPDSETRRRLLLSASPEDQQAFAALTPEELRARVAPAGGGLGEAMASPRTSGEAFSRVFPYVAPTAARVGGAMAAAPGGLFGASMMGGGEAVAQGVERLFGSREAFNPTQMGVQAGLGLIPGAALMRGAVRGAVGAGGGYAATEAAEGRPALTAGTGLAALAGAAGGGVAGRLAERMAQGAGEAKALQQAAATSDTGMALRAAPETAQDALQATIAGRATSTPFPMAIAAPGAAQAATAAPPVASRMAAVDAAVAAPVKPRASAGQVRRFTKLRELGVPEETARKLSERLVTPLEIGGKPTKDVLAPTRARLAKDLGRAPDAATEDAFDALGIAYQEAKAAGAPQAEQRSLGAMLSGAGRQVKTQAAASAAGDAVSRLRGQAGAITTVAARELGQTAVGAATGGLLGAYLGGEDDAEMGFTAGVIIGGLAATGRGREIITDGYAANLLGNLSSLLVRNPVSQALYGAYRNATRPLTAVADMGLSALRGQPRSVFAGEALPRLVAARQAVTAGLSDMWEVLRSGKRPDYLFAETATGGKTLDVQGRELPGGALSNFAPRLINAYDAWDFKAKEVIARAGAAFSESMSQKGRASWADIAARTANPSARVQKVAREEARDLTFKPKPTAGTQHILALRDEMPALRLVFTFMQTPEAITRSGLQFTPAAALYRATSGRQPSGATGVNALFSGSNKEIAQITAGKAASEAGALATRERVRGAEQATDLAMGLAFGGTMLALADRDFLSGPMPRDERERTMWEMEGRAPWSMRLPIPRETLEAAGYDTTDYTGHAWVPMSGLLGPLALPAMYVAAVDDAWRRGEVDEVDAGQRLWNALPKMLEATADQFWIGEMQAISKALDGQEGFSTYAAEKIANLMPGSALLRQITTGVDPVSRKTRVPDDFRAEIRNEVRSRLPGQSESLPAKVLGLGTPKTADVPDNWPGRLLIPRISLEKRDRALEALLHADYPIGLPEGRLTFGGQEIPQTPNEQAETAATRGLTFRSLLEPASAQLQQKPPPAAQFDIDQLRSLASEEGTLRALSDRQKARQEAFGILNPKP